MPAHPLVLDRNHLFVDLPEGRFLLDTGSPGSFASTRRATLFGRTHALPNSLLGVDAAAIEKLAGPDCVGLLGLDFLAARPTLWDGVTLQLAEDEPPPPGAAFFPASFTGALICDALLGGRPARIALDSGAQYGYVRDRAFVAGGSPLAEIEDFHPMLGAFRSPSWQLPVTLAGVTVPERLGLLPEPGATMLRMLSLDAVVGLSWLAGRKLWLSPEEGRGGVVG